MALSKAISDRGSHGHHTFTLTVTETAVNTSANTSTCSVKFTISPYQTGYNWEDFTGSEKPKGTVTFNGTSYSWELPNYNGKSAVTLVSKTGITVKHGSDGKKTVSFGFSCSSGSTSYLPGSASGSGSLTLTAIPRVPTVTQKVSSKTETSITMTWSSDLTIDTIRYSTNGGSTWTYKNVTDGKSGSYTVSGLSANTSYSMKTELHSKESGLSGQSSALSVKTYNWPYATISNFNVKDGTTVTIVNPLDRQAYLRVYAEGVEIYAWDGAYTDELEQATLSAMLEKIPSSMTGSWYCTVTYGGHTTTTAIKTYSATGYNPTITSAAYADSNATAQAIIQDTTKILQNVSTPAFSISGTALYGASIASASVTILNSTQSATASGGSSTVSFGVIDSATNVPAKVTITDSRGNTASQNVTVTMAAYTLPSALITLSRRNNYYSQTDITVDAGVMSFPGNTPTITARWKEEGASAWEGSATLQDNVQSTITLGNEKAWTVQVTVTDSFGGSTSYDLYVGIGLPIFYIDRMLRAVGINCFPENGVPFAVEGVDILGELFYKPGDKFTVSNNGVGGAPFAGYVTSSTTNIRIMIPVGKSLANISAITCNVCKGQIRGISGYVNGSSSSVSWESATTITCAKASDKVIQIQLHSSSAYTNITNNTPVSLAAVELELEFS